MYQHVSTECLPELILGFLAARIDDCDEGYEHDDWQIESGPQNRTVSYPLRADRWWSKAGALDEGEDVGRCLGIRCNIWARAMRRREITHNLRGGGKENVGWGALMWQDMVGTGEVRFGTLEILRYLPKKIANFLHEFYACSGWFQSLNLPALPTDRSRIDVHAMLKPIHIASLLRRLQVNILKL